MKGTKLMIATPMYGGMCTGHYVAGLLKTFVTLQNFGVSVYWSQLMNESLITRARNELVYTFLDSDCDYLMFIDSDISFEGDAVAQLLVTDKDIVCGVYPKKEIDWGQIQNAAKQGVDNLQDYGGAFVLNAEKTDKTSDDSGAVEVRHGGTGFMLIKRKVFEILREHVPQYRTSTIKDNNGNYSKPLTYEFFTTSIDDTGCLLSEDYHFCELWRKHGGQIYVNPFIKLEHVGTYVYTGSLLKAGGNIK